MGIDRRRFLFVLPAAAGAAPADGDEAGPPVRRVPATAGRVLHRVETHGFAPTGAPSVRVRFEVADGRATALSIHDPTPTVTATRVAGG